MFLGVITSLHSSGGCINRMYDFEKIDALKDWKTIKLGQRVSFLLFQDSVRNVIVNDNDWENDLDQEVQLKIEEKTIGCNVETKTIVGTVSAIHDGILVVDIGKSKPEYVDPEKFPDLKLQFAEQDSVSPTNQQLTANVYFKIKF